ncbi:Shikimate O-hydroxycinnamoyltransferase [Handroanthus impetiginosus]|uniref:Shikimate O-hydroxycinnamoyltransferase n=1 Tax=Handroanthus impetiginosus TaxID=429701 RepID=A0A2G9HPS4_9LAMI|nr:Shikimate O-hydroxycinnamoyltransferase [Handroanthus impetiginosus]
MAQGKMSKIQIISTSAIQVPSHTKSTSPINLTPWDLELLFLEYSQKGLLFLKPNRPQEHTILVLIRHLKTTLQRTLHFFPPLAGSLSTTRSDDGAATCFSIDCNNNNNNGGGAFFIHAYANLTVADILNPSTYVHEIVPSFFPLTEVRNSDGISQPLLAVQVTELADGLFTGCSINHLLVDGTSFWHFFNSWAEISRGKIPISHQISNLHFLSRDQITLDLIGSGNITIRDEHLILDKIKPIPQSSQMRGNIICQLQHIWRSIIRCRFAMNPNIQETTFEIPMGARQRLNPPLPQEYFGNAVFPGIVTLEARKMPEKGRGWTAWQINRMVDSCKGPEKVKEFYVNWIKNPKFLQFDGLPSNHFILINSPRFHVYGNDFGWGKPVGVRSGRANSFDGRIVISEGLEEGSMEVGGCLFPETLPALMEDAEFMLKH